MEHHLLSLSILNWALGKAKRQATGQTTAGTTN
jgi:hypothetical protein